MYARSSSRVSGEQLRPRGAGSCGTRRPSARAPRTSRRRSAPATASVRPGANGTVTSWPAFRAACSTAAHPPRTIRSASDTLLAAGLGAVEVRLDLLEDRQHRGQLGRAVDLPVPLRGQADPRPVGPAAHVGAAEARRRRPGGGDQLGDGQPRVEEPALERRDVLGPDQLVVDRRDGVLPQLRLRDPRAEVAADRPHVAVQQLEPGLGEGLGQLVRVLVEALGDRAVDRIHPQREVRRQHDRGVALGRIVGVGHGALSLGILGRPLLRAGRARGQLPVVAEQDVQVSVVPPGRLVGPGALQPAGDRVGALAAAEGVLPAEALLLERGRLRLRTDVLRDRPRRGSCRRCGRRRSARPSPRRSSPSERRSRGCPGPTPADRGCRSVPRDSRRSGPSGRRRADRRAPGRRCSVRRRARCPPVPRRSPRAPRRPRVRSRSRTS